jgi:hypothetical protein
MLRFDFIIGEKTSFARFLSGVKVGSDYRLGAGPPRRPISPAS